MKKLEFFEMEGVEGGEFFEWETLAGVGCGVAFISIVAGSALISGGVATAGGVAAGVSLGLHACALGALSKIRF